MILRRVGGCLAVIVLLTGASGCAGGMRDAALNIVPVSGFKERGGRLVHAGGGLTAVKQDGGVYRIKARSTSVSPPDRAEKMALMQAAQLARLEGRSHVVIVSKQSGIMCGFQYGAVVSAEPRADLTVRLENSLSEFAPDGFEVAERLPELWASVRRRDYTMDEKKAFNRENKQRCGRGRMLR